MLQAFEADGPEGWETQQELGEPGGKRNDLITHPIHTPAPALTHKASLGAPAQQGWGSGTASSVTKAVELHPELCRGIMSYVPSLEEQVPTVGTDNVLRAELEESSKK